MSAERNARSHAISRKKMLYNDKTALTRYNTDMSYERAYLDARSPAPHVAPAAKAGGSRLRLPLLAANTYKEWVI